MMMNELKLNVLVVDDNHLNLRVMRQILRTKLADSLHLDCLQTASSGLEALELIKTSDFNLLFLDISMPGISGLEVCRRLRNDIRHQHIHICAVTTDLADWQVQLYKSYGMDGVIGKPLKSNDLGFALKACQESILNPTRIIHPEFYFLRHGAQQVLPIDIPTTIEPITISEPVNVVKTDPLSCSLIGLTPSIRLPTILECSRANSKFRQQSVVSDTNVAGVLAFEEARRFPGLNRTSFDLIDENLLVDCRPSFDSFDTSSASGSIITCSSSAPSSGTAIDLLSPTYGTEEEEEEQQEQARFSSHHKHFPAFPTAPILTSTTHDLPLGLRSPRRWSSPLYSLSEFSPTGSHPAAREENDVFAAGFMAAMNHMAIDQACSQWGENCLSATTITSTSDPPVHEPMPPPQEEEEEEEEDSTHLNPTTTSTTTTPTTLSNWIEQEDLDHQHRWASLAGPIHCEESTLSSVRRQLISRRSHPLLRLQPSSISSSSSSSTTLKPTLEPESEPCYPYVMRKSKSDAGLPLRPSWQLVQLSAINYQSVLKSGLLLDEVLFGLDLEDSSNLPLL
ncbi:hypothetical protein Pst134EA_004648 [Puccinia striiformis f. sp. tritici]|uniref:hypothetical protein n=1 Tax=Puccinia striiformis f. sp. tritici TaxID=168172 RepID=UPI00200894A5|nr:hypothetical protein Pst134EA_004648 [Puccinia striiformis f. sp. tritici]KAH9470724.1 hypothetical protein Pst134EA_004648 [Puccinia striiformis f. sp. tritici]KAI9623020.1 hypothetical protein KEM48_009637 [Puccinia striiformis f. sp. tritici PST-130]